VRELDPPLYVPPLALSPRSSGAVPPCSAPNAIASRKGSLIIALQPAKIDRSTHWMATFISFAVHFRANTAASMHERRKVPATLATYAGLMRTIGRWGLRRATSLKPALSYMDFAPNHIYSSLERAGLSTG
jgi:hypothetical protein